MTPFSAAFLDRDGTINVKAPEGEYVTSPSSVALLPGAAGAIRALNELGIPVFVVTNQRGIALGRMTEDDLAAVHARLDELLAEEGARIDAYYHCPHDRGECDCRKPGTAMLERAAEEHGVELGRSLMVGDGETDVEAGRRVGATTVRLVVPGAGHSAPRAGPGAARSAPPSAADHTAASLGEAVWLVLP